MADLKIDLGIREYTVAEGCSVRFNPTDPAFIERFCNTFDELEKLQKEKNDIRPDGADVFDMLRELERDMRGKINGLFGKDICSAVFRDPEMGDLSIFAACGGLPGWYNLMFAFLDEMDSAITREQKETSPRLKKYLAKYGKKK